MDSKTVCHKPCSEEAFCYNPGIIGKRYAAHGIMFVLHRSDSRALPVGDDVSSNLQGYLRLGHGAVVENIDYLKALKESDTGRLLSWLLGYCGMTFDDVYITNLFKCLLPGDRFPLVEEYKSCANVLKDQVLSAKPKKIVAFGRFSFRYMFPEKAGKFGLEFESAIDTESTYNGVPSLVAYHPRRLNNLEKRVMQSHLVKIKSFLSAR